ncbi:MAG: MlaE family lipid ABC transporter permease subunit [Candidatus Electryoneaceae bacterium]|nr:MlaE family lipid ABC transporter permease subunit [Candidatus Electryoneaceae bacterium]
MTASQQTITFHSDESSIHLVGSLRGGGPRRLLNNLIRAVGRIDSDYVEMDLSDLNDIDGFGAALIEELIEQCKVKGKTIRLVNVHNDVDHILKRYSYSSDNLHKQDIHPRVIETIGDRFYTLWADAGHLLVLVSESFYWTMVGLWNPKGHRKGAVAAQAMAIGVGALPVVSLIAFLMGVVLALQSAAQLRQFGANIFVADLVCIAMAREMGPLMTAVILAGRSGASIAAEISSMTVSEEIDALVTMGIKPIRYIVVPKIIGITLTAPLLTILSVIIGIVGGFVVAVNTLDLSPQAFYIEAVSALFLKDIVTGLIKSVVFAWLIVILAAYFGFQVTGGPEGVGRATTKAVVASIFTVIIADAILGLLFYL